MARDAPVQAAMEVDLVDLVITMGYNLSPISGLSMNGGRSATS
jgi:hypothetical protein